MLPFSGILSSILYLSILSLTTTRAFIRSPRRLQPCLPVRLSLLLWTLSAALFLLFRHPLHDATWLPSVWMPVEIVSVLVSAYCLYWMIARETEDEDELSRFTLRFSLFTIPISVAAMIWAFDPHNSWYWIAVAARSRFWQGMLLAWVIVWANQSGGRRMSADGVLCLHVSIINGVIGSFNPPYSPYLPITFRLIMTAALLWRTTRPSLGPAPSPFSSSLLNLSLPFHDGLPEHGARQG